jgi:alkanesulfonate monooxygenase SsuD/methylene tetrahydromethanopterin reductase-like flavin-dependent oxidoreductase (luciferase family)
MADRLRFGIFLAPFHPPTQNPTLALERDLELVAHLDRLGYDEAWFGEHHSCGSELIASPEIFIAVAAERTRHIRLGTGVLSLPYHNPLWVADRMILLDHLTRGRAMLGVGPGALPTDARMIGIDPADQRAALEHDMDVLMHLLRSDEPISVDTDRYRLVEAQTQLRPYSDPCFEVAVAAIASPSGPRIAGKHGLGLLSVGATQKIGFDVLALHWSVMEERAAEFGSSIDRDGWRLVGPMYVAETRDQAIKDVQFGHDAWFDYLQNSAAAPQFSPGGTTFQERVDWVIESGVGIIGTVEDAAAQIDGLLKQSGGFGAFLQMAHEWATPDNIKKSYELIARYVFPQFQGSAAGIERSDRRARDLRPELFDQQAAALAAWTERHAKERAEKGG